MRSDFLLLLGQFLEKCEYPIRGLPNQWSQNTKPKLLNMGVGLGDVGHAWLEPWPGVLGLAQGPGALQGLDIQGLDYLCLPYACPMIFLCLSYALHMLLLCFPYVLPILFYAFDICVCVCHSEVLHAHAGLCNPFR